MNFFIMKHLKILKKLCSVEENSHDMIASSFRTMSPTGLNMSTVLYAKVLH